MYTYLFAGMVHTMFTNHEGRVRVNTSYDHEARVRPTTSMRLIDDATIIQRL